LTGGYNSKVALCYKTDIGFQKDGQCRQVVTIQWWFISSGLAASKLSSHLKIPFDRGHLRGQFHQHFTQAFFVQKCFVQFFSYILGLTKGFSQKSTFV